MIKFAPFTFFLLSNCKSCRFSVGKLPVWAKKQLTGGPGQGNPSDNPGDLPKGRWAARIGGQSTLKSHYDSDSVIPFPASGHGK